MKKIVLSFTIFALLIMSCKEVKTEKSNEVDTTAKEQTAMAYQCPMDCESGKTYNEAGTCAVCKMDLKANTKEMAMECKMCDGGECTCKTKDHSTEKSPGHEGKLACAMHKDGDCTCKA